MRFIKKENHGRWGKVYKRYFTLAGKTESTFLESYVPNIIRDSPEIRESAFLYYSSIGYSRKRFKQLIDFFLTQDCFCDVTIFSVARILTAWEISHRSKSIREVIDAAKNRLKHFQSPASFVAALWILSKYSSESDLFSIIWSNRTFWESSDFASRQVACVTPILNQNKQHSQKIEKLFIETGRLQAIRVVESINLLRNSATISKDLSMYLTQKNRGIYPLSKFLILISVLQSPNIPLEIQRNLKEKIMSDIITDQVYLKTLRAIEYAS